MKDGVSRDRRVDSILGVTAGILAFGLYLRTMAPGLLAGDSGEFQFAAPLGGFVHPTGYPLYLAAGYLWTHLLPWHDPAWRMNLLSALCGALAIGLFFPLALLMVRLSLRGSLARAVAFFAALTFAVTPIFWSQALIAEVYALNALFCVSILLALARVPDALERGSYKPVYVAAVLLGLSLAHHRSTLLWAPAIVLYLWGILHGARRQDAALRDQESRLGKPRPWLRVAAICAALVLLPQLFYLYIPLRAPLAPYSQVSIGPSRTLELYQSTLEGFIRYATGQAFEAQLGTPGQALSRIGTAAAQLVHGVTWAGAALGLAGLVVLARRSRPLLALTALGFCTLLVFNLFYGIGDISAYYIPLHLVWTLWAAMGVAGLCSAASRATAHGAGTHARLAWAPCLLAFALPAWLLASNFKQVDLSHDNAARGTWEALLAGPLPADALLVSNDRDEMMPQWYLRYLEGVRPDVTGLFPQIQPGPGWSDVGGVVAEALDGGRAVLLIKPMPGLEVRYRLVEDGKLVRVTGPAITKLPDRPRAVDYGDTIRLNGYDVRPGMLKGGETLTVDLYWEPLRPPGADYSSFVHILNADGRLVGQSDHRPGGVFYPSRLWRPGETILDEHALTLEPELGRAPYAIEAGLYRGSPNIEHLGQPARIGMLSRARPPDAPPGPADEATDYRFGEEIALDGHRTAVHDGRLDVKLNWRALRAPQSDYTVFIHVLDADGRIVAQSDQQPAAGEMPTSSWPVGYRLVDTMAVTLPAELPAGPYDLIVGLYDATTAARLLVQGADSRPAGDAVALGKVILPSAGGALLPVR